SGVYPMNQHANETGRHRALLRAVPRGAVPPQPAARARGGDFRRASAASGALAAAQAGAAARSGSREPHRGTYVARMTSAQKVGQLIQADIDSITPDDLAHDPLGSVLNGGNSSPMAISSLHRVSGSRWPTGSMTFRSGQGAPPGSPSCGVPTRCT